MEAALGELEIALVVVPIGSTTSGIRNSTDSWYDGSKEVHNSSEAVCLHRVDYKIHIYHS